MMVVNFMQSLKELYKIGNGPSSSHTMGPKRAALYYLDKYPNCTRYEVILYGSLALTGKGHLTDKIIYDTFIGKNIKVIFDYKTVPDYHPNMMDFKGYIGDNLINTTTIYSIGGGTIQIKDDELIENDEIYQEKNFKEVKEFCLKNNLRLAEYVYYYEPKAKEYLEEVYSVMLESIERGLTKEGTLPGKLMVKRKAKTLLDSHDPLMLVSAYAYAVSEENASGGVIVTAPTCGASGIVPACLKYLLDKGYQKEKLIDGLACASVIGNIIKQNASISGAECGCQAEVGSATSMAAALIGEVMDFSIEQIEHAAEIAMEHQLGLTCDPVDGYVQIPCIERNAIASMRAIHSAMLAKNLTETQKVSFDVVVETMRETGKDLNKNYRETSEGGLAKKYHC